MTKSLLIVTPFFAPQSHAAVFRAHKLAKHLPRLGWKPYVLTIDTNYLYNEDPGLLDELPPEIEIHRARYIEPTLRGLRMAIGGKDRTFRALKDGSQAVTQGPSENEMSPTMLQRVYRAFIQRYVSVPDMYRTWLTPAVRLGRRLIERYNIGLVYTTCLPYTCNRIGMGLQSTAVKWVADFRDPAGCATRMISPEDRVARVQRAIVGETLERADAVVSLSSSYSGMFREMFPRLGRDRVQFIPTGLDEDLLKPDPPDPIRPYPYLLFAGEFLPEYDDTFLSVYQDAMQIQSVRDSGVRLMVVGHSILNRAGLMPRLQARGLEGCVEFLDHQPQESLYRLIRGAKACLLIPGREALWWANFAKLVDYVALRKPVIAVVPDPSEARSVLCEARLGIFLDGSHGSCVRTLADFLIAGRRVPLPNQIACDRYTAKRQVGDFADLFASVLQ